MTAKEFVQSKYPNAKSEKRFAFAMVGKVTYWLIINGNNEPHIAGGYSESSAWVNAKNTIIQTLNSIK